MGVLLEYRNHVVEFLRRPHPFGYSGIFLAFVVWVLAVTIGDGPMAAHMRNVSIWEVTAEFVTVMFFGSMVFAWILVMLVAIGGTEWTDDKQRTIQGLPLLTYGNFFRWALLGVGSLLLWPLWKKLFAGIRYSVINTRYPPGQF